jgi:hypothetical protein
MRAKNAERCPALQTNYFYDLSPVKRIKPHLGYLLFVAKMLSIHLQTTYLQGAHIIS